MNAEHWKKQAEIYRENLLEAKKLFDLKFTLTDEEINEVIRIEASKDPAGIGWNLAFNVARAILRKAQEK